jgi:hypothetical protein
MNAIEIAVVACIAALFVTFGVVLAAAARYARSTFRPWW